MSWSVLVYIRFAIAWFLHVFATNLHVNQGLAEGTLWEILVNSQKYRSSYFLNQASKLAGKIFRDMEIFSISLKNFSASLEAWFKK